MLPEFDARYLAFSVIIAKCFKALNAIYLKTLSAKKGPTHAYLSVYWKCPYPVNVKVALSQLQPLIRYTADYFCKYMKAGRKTLMFIFFHVHVLRRCRQLVGHSIVAPSDILWGTL